MSLCRRCILDSRSPGITLDDEGICNNCRAFDELLDEYPLDPDRDRGQLESILAKIRAAGQGKPYDCVIGTSGGTDSTYSIVKAKEAGLRPLAVHFDNGWNSAAAVQNIQGTLERLEVPLWTYVVDWQEFRDIQLAFLRAGVPSVEVPTDIGIRSALYRAAVDVGVKWVISGNCFRAEGIVPHAWGVKDGKQLSFLKRHFGSGGRLKSFPNLPLGMHFYYAAVRRIRIFRILNYFDYSKETAKEELKHELGWIDYGGHHHESIYTRFFQSYIAREKFHMDRRPVTLSAAVRLGRLSRSEALVRAQEDDYTRFMLKDDLKYVAKKLEVGVDELKRIIEQPAASIFDFPGDYRLVRSLQGVLKVARRAGLLTGAFQAGGL